MTAIDRTTYPRPRELLTQEELDTRFALTDADADVAFVCAAARGGPGRVTLATMLAIHRDVGTFPTLSDVPAETVAYLSARFGLEKPPALVERTTQPKRSTDTEAPFALT